MRETRQGASSKLCLPPSRRPEPTVNAFNQIAEITPYLFLSPATALTGPALASLQPSLVINVTKELPCHPLVENSIKLPLEDSHTENIFPHLAQLTAVIRREAEVGGRVLVHCVAGSSRSVTVVLAYLVNYYCDLHTAWQHVKTIRPWVGPNNNFMDQLIQWELSNK